MRAFALLTVLAFMLAGCAGEGPDDVPAPPAAQEPIPATPGSPGYEPSYETKTLKEGRFTTDADACAPTLPTAPPVPTEDIIHEIVVPEGTKSLTAIFTEIGQPDVVTPPTIKMYGPNQEIGGPAKSEKGWNGGTITFTEALPEKGVWSFTLYHCDVPTTGQHALDSIIRAAVQTN